MTLVLDDWVTTRRLARLLGMPQHSTANLYRQTGFPAHALMTRDGYLLWHYPSVAAWSNGRARSEHVCSTARSDAWQSRARIRRGSTALAPAGDAVRHPGG
jgi:hypothetical protein